jgi:sorting nexin-29
VLNSSYNIFAKIIYTRLKTTVDALLFKEQQGFRRGRSTTDNVFTLQQLREIISEFTLETHLAFIDYEKAFDRVNCNKLWDILYKCGYPKTSH